MRAPAGVRCLRPRERTTDLDRGKPWLHAIPHRFVNELDDSAIGRLIARLEGRAKDVVFTRLFDKYAGHLAPHPSARVLEVGCGTGATIRALARRADFPARRLALIKALPSSMRRAASPGMRISAIESISWSAMRT
jgi:SAM-dependent methyltransferase